MFIITLLYYNYNYCLEYEGLAELSMTDPADELLEHYLEGREEGAVYIKKYIKDVLVKCIHFNGSAEDVAKEVTDTFSRLLCVGKPPEQELPRLKAILGSSGPCGKTLSNGEPTFTCSDCALDPTCVMCMECYNASVHCAENHNLEVHTSLGCGMCDCGDEEAWTSVSDVYLISTKQLVPISSLV